MNSLDFSKDLLNFIDNSPLNYFAVANAKDILSKNGFKELKENNRFCLFNNEREEILYKGSDSCQKSTPKVQMWLSVLFTSLCDL